MKIFTRLFLSHASVGLLAIVALFSISYFLLSDILIQRTLDQLSSVNILKKDLVENHFFNARQNLEELQLEHKFLNLYNTLTRPHTANDPDLLEMDEIARLYDFKNIHVLDSTNHQLFSIGSEPYPESLTGKIDSLIKSCRSSICMVDASPYSPDKRTLLFYYIPIIKNNHQVATVWVAENFEKIQSILFETTGMGSTGESYIVGNDFTMRSASRFLPDESPGSIRIKTGAVKKSFQGVSGSEVLIDYRGEKVLSVYRSIDDTDLQWALISEIDLWEAMQPIIRLRYYFISITLLVILLTIGITYFLSNALATPILQLKNIITALSKGIIPKTKLHTKSSDEIGQMAESIYQLTSSMEQTTVFAHAIGTGDFNMPFTTLSEDDTLGLALIHMRDELKSFNERELKLARSRAAALLEGQENERRRIIQELHDGVGQLLTAIRMRVDLLESNQGVRDEIKKQIDDTISEVKRISYNVMPQALVDYGLNAALRGLCENIKKYASLQIDFNYVQESDRVLNFEISTAVFRIAQEGLNNILKHSGATHVTLHVLDKEDEIYFLLEDNGKGFNKKSISHDPGSGLRNIRERAKILNGTTEVHTNPGQGTVIEIHIPIVETIHEK